MSCSKLRAKKNPPLPNKTDWSEVAELQAPSSQGSEIGIKAIKTPIIAQKRQYWISREENVARWLILIVANMYRTKTPQERLYICMEPPITPHIRTIIGHHLRSLLWARDLSCGTEELVEMKMNSPNYKEKS